jgi:crotonobetainyl-CoA:carnitine CoA-transferase CaiB-like acyl-CoA transferase
MARQPSAHWAEKFRMAGVPFAPINDLSDLVGTAQAGAQVDALGMLAAIPGLDIQTIGFPVSFDGERPVMRTPAPPLLPQEVQA